MSSQGHFAAQIGVHGPQPESQSDEAEKRQKISAILWNFGAKTIVFDLKYDFAIVSFQCVWMLTILCSRKFAIQFVQKAALECKTYLPFSNLQSQYWNYSCFLM